ncbi:class I SAM-dependent methyltransferase [Dongia deserti]|uniref:class I SAM-dependent methyltransferase n=1 Tax=Dongia deserti TaxID=2268030 RepID=UPI000E65928F|nr:class I SAM-dependent methyltransferase [Dongia deserti]
MDSDWAQGYVTEVLYTEHFFRELSPSWLNYVAVLNGCQPRPLDPGFTYMELGCGLGQTVTLLAGAHPQGRFYGVDFNPAHIDWARRYAASAGIGNVQFLERSFLDLTAQEVPECDFIVLHGVYAWVAPEVRAGIQRIILERLKPGGLVYNSYNCLPGWAADSPLQKLVYETARNLTGDASQRTQGALKAIEELVGAKFAYFAATPTAGKMAAKMAERNANYLAHEFLNEHWTPFYSTDVADEMANAKLNFVGSATLAENHLELLGGDELQAKVKTQPTQRLRQLFQDLAQNQRFRRDVFVRGHAQLNRAGIMRNMESQVFGAMRDLRNVTNVAKVARGEVKFDEKAFPALKEALQQGTWSIGELRREMAARKLMHLDVERTMTLLAATSIAVPCAASGRPAPMPANPKQLTIPLAVNRALVKRMVDNLTPGNLVSTLAGNALSLDPIFAVILSLGTQPWKDRDELKEGLLAEVKRRRIRFSKPAKEEKPLDDAGRAAQFFDRFWTEEAPILHRLGVIELA